MTEEDCELFLVDVLAGATLRTALQRRWALDTEPELLLRTVWADSLASRVLTRADYEIVRRVCAAKATQAATVTRLDAAHAALLHCLGHGASAWMHNTNVREGYVDTAATEDQKWLATYRAALYAAVTELENGNYTSMSGAMVAKAAARVYTYQADRFEKFLWPLLHTWCDVEG